MAYNLVCPLCTQMISLLNQRDSALKMLAESKQAVTAQRDFYSQAHIIVSVWTREVSLIHMFKSFSTSMSCSSAYVINRDSLSVASLPGKHQPQCAWGRFIMHKNASHKVLKWLKRI